MKIPAKYRDHFRENRVQYIIVVAFFVLGLIMGNFKVGDLDEAVRTRLLQMLDAYFGGQQSATSGFGIFIGACLNQGRFMLAVWALGLTVIGVPLIILIVFLRGFSLGFTIGFLLQEKAGTGVVLSLISLLPQNLIYIPLLLIAAVLAVNFSLYILRGPGQKRASLGVSLLGYTVLMGLVMVVFMPGAFIEAYLVPWLLNMLIK